MSTKKVAAVALAIAACGVMAAQAAEIRLLLSNTMTPVMNELAPQFEKAAGHTLSIAYGSTNPLKVQIEKGAAFDLTILADAALDDLIKQGRLVAATRTVVARSGLGVAIRRGAPKPDIATVDGFKRTLLDARHIAYGEQGLTGVYLKGLFQRLGIAEALKPKIKDARAAEAAAAGDADIGITQASEILPVAGAELAGPLPPEIQNYSVLVAGVGSGATQADAASVLLKFLTGPDAARVVKANGLELP
jgi:molybdate transport system substrate-binding protein